MVSGASPLYAFTSLAILLSGAFFLGMAGITLMLYARSSPWPYQLRSVPAVQPETNNRDTLSSSPAISKVVSEAFFGQYRVVLVVSLLYAVFFAVIDAVLIYQPNVDFLSAYNVSGITLRVLTCCGGPADVPVFLVYFPAQHMGIQLIPLSVLLMILVSMLVGLNVSLLFTATRLSRGSSAFLTSGSSLRRGKARVGRKRRTSLGGIAGAIFGLFSGCPTCAAAFFVSMVAGSGATAVSSLLSQYQPAIVGLTIPLLLGSIYWQAKSVRILMQGCSV